MKKIIFFFLIFFVFNYSVFAVKYEVELSKCVDGDTAYFILNDEEIKTRFLAINTPESTNKIEAYGKEASEYTCNLLKNSNKIEIEYDKNSEKLDKYNRHLVWVFVDDELLQRKLVQQGLAEIKYIYGDYSYIDILEKEEEIAKNEKLKIWSNYQEEKINYYILFGIIFIIIILCIFSAKYRNKVKRKAKNKLKKLIKDKIKS